MREARDGAKKEIEAYRAEKEAEFKKFESEVWRYISLFGMRNLFCPGETGSYLHHGLGLLLTSRDLG